MRARLYGADRPGSTARFGNLATGRLTPPLNRERGSPAYRANMVLPALVALLASAVALVSARAHRMHAMAIAAGISAALSPAGVALIPVLLGTAVAYGRAGRVVALFAASLFGAAVTVGRTSAVVDISLWPYGMQVRGLLLAVAIGGAAWLAAACAARRLDARELMDAALLAAIAGPLLIPIGAESLLLAAGLTIAGARPRAPVRGANDNPLSLRATA